MALNFNHYFSLIIEIKDNNFIVVRLNKNTINYYNILNIKYTFILYILSYILLFPLGVKIISFSFNSIILLILLFKCFI